MMATSCFTVTVSNRFERNSALWVTVVVTDVWRVHWTSSLTIFSVSSFGRLIWPINKENVQSRSCSHSLNRLQSFRNSEWSICLLLHSSQERIGFGEEAALKWTEIVAGTSTLPSGRVLWRSHIEPSTKNLFVAICSWFVEMTWTFRS